MGQALEKAGRTIASVKEKAGVSTPVNAVCFAMPAEKIADLGAPLNRPENPRGFRRYFKGSNAALRKKSVQDRR